VDAGSKPFQRLWFGRDALPARKRLKPLPLVGRPSTRLKPGVNERRKSGCKKTSFMQFSCMPFTTITISTDAHERLRNLKEPGDSFSDVILRNVHQPCETAGELLDAIWPLKLPPMNPRRLALLRSGRGRRSNRPRKIVK
jgi:hypothetical protein